MSGKFMMNGVEYLGGGSGGGGGNVDDVLVNGVSVVNEDKEAEIVSYKEVTQAEYEALPDTKLTDGIAYFIKDSTEAEGYPPLILSTQEREVGVWIDGKPLYQRTLSFDNIAISANGFVTKDLSQFINYLDLALFHKTVIMMNGSPTELPAVHAGNQLSSYDISCVLTDNTLYLSRSSAGSITGNFKSTIWYTKTTDTPGGGLWAGNGAMAHHYSTDEVIIGTWIDGKPLYEKTTIIPSLPNQTETEYQLGISNIDSVAYFSASADNESVNLPLFYNSGNDNSSKIQCFIYNKANGIVKIHTFGDNRSSFRGIITIRYTKTTD